MFFSYVAEYGPETEWIRSARWVDEGAVATSSGVSAGIDLSLALIARLFGVERARQIAAGTEYEWHEDADDDPFAGQIDQAMPFVEALRSRAGEVAAGEVTGPDPPLSLRDISPRRAGGRGVRARCDRGTSGVWRCRCRFGGSGFLPPQE